MAIQTAMMDVKKLALDEAEKSLEALQYSRKSPVSKLQYYVTLIGSDPSVIPQIDADFQEIVNQIDAPVKDSSLFLSPYENEEMQQSSASQDFLTLVGALETLSGIFLALPTTHAHATPLGVGVAEEWGPEYIGNAVTASARALKLVGDQMAWQGANAGRKATYQKQQQDRVMQANSAGYEIKNIDQQVIAAQVRVQIAQKDIDIQQMNIDQAKEINDFLQNKYTNVQLYSWMESTTRSLYYQTYTIAYSLAKKAEQVFALERPLDATSPFIQPGYWDTSHDGLLAGEQLYLGLKNLEAAYLAKRGHDFEITKNISLRQVNPLELLTLRETGSCTFDLPELLFDMDFPGHYSKSLNNLKIFPFRIPLCAVLGVRALRLGPETLHYRMSQPRMTCFVTLYSKY
jgi:receptor-binding and translocation channel-forming TcA subunit of Tc toxin